MLYYLGATVICFRGEHFLVPEHSLRFQHQGRVSILSPDIRERLGRTWAVSISRAEMIPKCIGGVLDHVHILVLPTRLAVAKAVQLAVPIIPYPTGRFFERHFPRHCVQAAIVLSLRGRAGRHFAQGTC